jgi:hypothetical protein
MCRIDTSRDGGETELKLIMVNKSLPTTTEQYLGSFTFDFDC